ncbi:unnamed protein product [Trichogramma brassicae]|uniref:Uncharacterized protein n=1 Tax=Trichogramma brassicae TaxID=86971 RepID=A0A6H5IVM1_9HYME|nr:unnamed protein product [Trichogramma brassicae]
MSADAHAQQMEILLATRPGRRVRREISFLAYYEMRRRLRDIHFVSNLSDESEVRDRLLRVMLREFAEMTNVVPWYESDEARARSDTNYGSRMAPKMADNLIDLENEEEPEGTDRRVQFSSRRGADGARRRGGGDCSGGPPLESWRRSGADPSEAEIRRRSAELGVTYSTCLYYAILAYIKSIYKMLRAPLHVEHADSTILTSGTRVPIYGERSD